MCQYTTLVFFGTNDQVAVGLTWPKLIHAFPTGSVVFLTFPGNLLAQKFSRKVAPMEIGANMLPQNGRNQPAY
jgi:hypothetical protein